MKTLALLVGIMILLIDNTFAQRGRFEFESPENRYVEIPFDVVNNLVIFKLIVNGSDSLNFILDTGVRRSILLDTSSVKPATMQLTYPVSLKGLGQNQSITAYLSAGNMMRMHGVRGTNQWICVIQQQQNEFSQRMGRKINGIIGCDFFMQFIVDLNFDSKIMTLYKPSAKMPRSLRRFHYVPFKFEDEKPVMNVVVVQNNIPYSFRTLIDTGLSDAIWAFSFNNSELELPAKNFETILGGGLNGDIQGKAGKIGTLILGDYSMNGVIAAFPDSASVGDTNLLQGRDGSIGNELFRRFHVVIDYQNQRIGLRPGKEFRHPFRYNRSGIDLIAQKPGVPIYQVSEIRKGSPADRAGVRIGDMLIRVQGENCFNNQLDEVYELLNPEKPRKIKIQVMRSGHVQKIVLEPGTELD
jgi:hypothetical protein